jgi:hypothetical protein
VKLFLNLLQLLLGILTLSLSKPIKAQEFYPPRTIMLIVDGLASGAIDRIPLAHLSRLKNEGTYYKEIHLPLPAHPDKSVAYPWSCSLPNPVLMSGTLFIGRENLKKNLIQHSFKNQKTAFIVNDRAYEDVSGGFDTYIDLRQNFEDIFKDEIVFETTKKIIREEDPVFLRVHIQGPGSSGYKSSEEINQNKVWYQDIWHPQSPYVNQLLKADKLINDFINWLKDEGLMTNTTIFIFGDHGQADTGWHPPYEPKSSKTELLIIGDGIKQHKVFEYAEIIDIVPTIAFIHQVEEPLYNEGRILKEAFKKLEHRPSEFENIKALNRLLIEAEKQKKSGKDIPTKFKGILEIGNWHNDLDTISIKNFIERQRRFLD